MQAKLLIIEGKRAGESSFAAGLAKKGFAVDCAPNGSAALRCLPDVDPDLVVVDAASLRTSGRRICQSLREQLDGLPIVLVVDAKNNPGEDVDANVILVLPFTIQKLINRIKPYLPGEEKNLLHVGPIRLDLEQRRVRCLGQQSRLTPRLVKLLQTLIEHRGVVVERTELFKVVWDTNYTLDTRTLDVHISWLREALEVDPRHPRFLKTIRGVGYRLDV
ncbi:MAG: response regulator transcription factor [Anaerolineaceae bacterium]|nr:response regulator transcription factor [Anaerolineaceae bacterium]